MALVLTHPVPLLQVRPQWFVRMEPLAKPALDAVASGDVRIVPDRFEKVYNRWLENIRVGSPTCWSAGAGLAGQGLRTRLWCHGDVVGTTRLCRTWRLSQVSEHTAGLVHMLPLSHDLSMDTVTSASHADAVHLARRTGASRGSCGGATKYPSGMCFPTRQRRQPRRPACQTTTSLRATRPRPAQLPSRSEPILFPQPGCARSSLIHSRRLPRGTLNPDSTSAYTLACSRCAPNAMAVAHTLAFHCAGTATARCCGRSRMCWTPGSRRACGANLPAGAHCDPCSTAESTALHQSLNIHASLWFFIVMRTDRTVCGAVFRAQACGLTALMVPLPGPSARWGGRTRARRTCSASSPPRSGADASLRCWMLHVCLTPAPQ